MAAQRRSANGELKSASLREAFLFSGCRKQKGRSTPHGESGPECAARGDEAELGFGVRVDVIAGLTNRSDFFGFFIRNFTVEFLLQSHNQLNGIQRIGAEVVNKGGFSDTSSSLLPQRCSSNNLLDAFFDGAAHGTTLPSYQVPLSTSRSLVKWTAFSELRRIYFKKRRNLYLSTYLMVS